MKTHYTPGPWEVRTLLKAGELVGVMVQARDGARFTICDMPDVKGSFMRANNRGNARLVAAAPDMARELRETLDEIQAVLDGRHKRSRLIDCKERIKGILEHIGDAQ